MTVYCIELKNGSTWALKDIAHAKIPTQDKANTRMAESIIKSEAAKDIAVGMIPLNRINEPEEIASTIFWLLTDAPDNITGQVFHLDGGMSQVRN